MNISRGTSRARGEPSNRSSTRRRVFTFIGGIVFFASVGALAFAFGAIENSRRADVLEKGRTTTGTPLSIEQDFNRRGWITGYTIVYGYEVGGVAYKVDGEPWDSRSDALEFRSTHSTVVVFYDPAHPDVAYAPAG